MKWQLPFAVLMMLSFALFVILYSKKSEELLGLQKKWAEVAARSASPLPAQKREELGPGDVQEVRTESVKSFRETLQNELGQWGGEATSVPSREGIKVSLNVKDYFDENSADIHPELLPLLDQVGGVLDAHKRRVVIVGQASPQEKGRYQSAWELASVRASRVAERWNQRVNLSNDRMEVMAQLGPGLGRSVEIVVLFEAGESSN